MLLKDLSVDCLSLNEHWLVADECNSLVLEKIRVAFGFCRSTKSHVGVGILIRNNIEFCSLGVEVLSEEQIAEVILMGFDIKLITVYRSPSGDFVRLLKVISNLLNKVSTCRSTIITGNLNEKDDHGLELCNFFRSFNLRKVVTVNT